ncbi:hypothetical protein AV955_gp113 [Diadromus pulchellus ascovirus 4a]|uniref:Complete DpAV4 genome n=1 Tax=Diadromus pulchellus ascovirus 4a TaxID=158683 RepID=F2NZ42_9VIRU|nr:hypothetical protein AV955_gp113 [Diadromus pulchellus ascovirus 4a]CCA61470.1 unnamed protein product [Diadromus pulchellus ascovirus 4a]
MEFKTIFDIHCINRAIVDACDTESLFALMQVFEDRSEEILKCIDARFEMSPVYEKLELLYYRPIFVAERYGLGFVEDFFPHVTQEELDEFCASWEYENYMEDEFEFEDENRYERLCFRQLEKVFRAHPEMVSEVSVSVLNSRQFVKNFPRWFQYSDLLTQLQTE